MSDKLVTIATFWDPIEANLARGRLADAGIRSFVADEQTVGMAWYLGNAIGGAKLQVLDSDAEAALDVLEEEDAAAAAVEVGTPIEADEAAPRVADTGDAGERALSAREENADRALRGAIIGLLLVPLQLYVFWLLLRVFVSTEEMRPSKRRAAIVAATINIPVLLAIGAYLRMR